MERRHYKHIILGLGALGSAAAWALARRSGGDVLGLEQYDLDHARGGSHDHSRIIRLSYNTPFYVELAKGAYAAWARLEAEHDLPLVHRVGGLDFFPEGGAIPLSDYADSLTAAGVHFDLLTGEETRKRWPQFRIDDSVRVLHQADGGFVSARSALGALRRSARDHGARLLEHTAVQSVRDLGGLIEVVTSSGVFEGEKLIIATGAWTNEILAQLGLQLPLTVTQEQVNYFAAEHLSQFMPGRFPAWIWLDDPCFYGLPVHGAPGVKVGQDVGGREVTPATRTFEPDLGTLRRVSRFVQRVLPDLGPHLFSKPCLYTMTPDRDFVVDTVPDHPDIVLAADAAHGFKFAAVIGEIAADLAAGVTPAFDLKPFAFDRPILREANPVRRFLT
ncbi:MAG: N-methyl-L-tryptophan oxidase [Anaerolineales bacterium]|nr:N-methyl-L-tryptophan oxidase [Anaerolineales bacterium]